MKFQRLAKGLYIPNLITLESGPAPWVRSILFEVGPITGAKVMQNIFEATTIEAVVRLAIAQCDRLGVEVDGEIADLSAALELKTDRARVRNIAVYLESIFKTGVPMRHPDKHKRGPHGRFASN